MKSFWGSKINIFNTISALIMFVDIITTANIIPVDKLIYFTLAGNFLNVILRTWFTSKPITEFADENA